MGAWIETSKEFTAYDKDGVASYVGAWIETLFGSKHATDKSVASYVGAWIETLGNAKELGVEGASRILCGCVD